jgi:hypothetical protein
MQFYSHISTCTVYIIITLSFPYSLQQIEYVRTTKDYHNERIYFSKMDYFLPSYIYNIPETFKDKYFLRKETENLLELKDIIDY